MSERYRLRAEFLRYASAGVHCSVQNRRIDCMIIYPGFRSVRSIWQGWAGSNCVRHGFTLSNISYKQWGEPVAYVLQRTASRVFILCSLALLLPLSLSLCLIRHSQRSVNFEKWTEHLNIIIPYFSILFPWEKGFWPHAFTKPDRICHGDDAEDVYDRRVMVDAQEEEKTGNCQQHSFSGNRCVWMRFLVWPDWEFEGPTRM